MEWPACSPDMNPIEHVWDALGRRVAGHQPHPQTLQELEKALLEEKLILNMAKSKKKCRQYGVDYLKFCFIESVSDKRLPLCLLCNGVLSNDAMKPSKLEDHLRCHPDKRSKDLKNTFKYSKKNCRSNPRWTEFLLQLYKETIMLDESTLPGNESLLLAYVHFTMDQEHHEEMLFARTLTTYTKGESLFNVLKEYFIENSIPLPNIISVATDGAPAMVGCYRGFIGHLKQNVSGC
ncbi:SCAN domain-containing protein 3 [Trichonephila clavipes]|nr:SCAN domain-containing protein 3 [Trichonephila clavipes]